MKFKDIIQSMIDNKENTKTFDPWVSSEEAAYNTIKNKSKKTYKGFKAIVETTSGGGCGMGAYPPEATIYLLHNFKEIK